MRATTLVPVLTCLEQEKRILSNWKSQVSHVICWPSSEQPCSAPPKFLVALPEKTTLTLGKELSFQCKASFFHHIELDLWEYSNETFGNAIVQVECSPLCGISWLLGEEKEPLVGESELHKIEEAIVEQSEDQFSYIESVLTFQHADDNITQFPISCRYVPK